MPLPASAALAGLSPTLRNWFQRRFGNPTTGQRLAWPALLEGRSLLLSAPTGSGKTLAAFLPLFDQLLQEEGPERLRVLYVSPLRALTNDVRVNLLDYLQDAQLDHVIHVATRTGDTESRHRSKLYVKPPSILLTTPESLALLLANPRAHPQLATLRHVVVDEVHQLADNKRGADLTLSLERLETLTRQSLQRIGLSATCSPIAEIAQWLVGVGRPVTTAVVPDTSTFDLRVQHLDVAATDEGPSGYVASLLRSLIPLLENQRTTLVFTNLRSIAERLTWSLRQRLPHWADQIALHHSALGVAVRREVEQQMKSGAYRVIVSSTSLELGIDVGSVDQVVLVHPPGGTARLLQRLGRSGHQPGRKRQGHLFSANFVELLEATASLAAGDALQLEPLRIPTHPLDVLAQQLIGMSIEQPRTAHQAWTLCRQAYPFRNLSFGDFVATLGYVGGGDVDQPVPARIRWVDERFRVLGDRTARIYRTNAGTIYEDDSRDVRATEGGELLGKVAEGFAAELQPGDRFALAGRTMEVASANGGAVYVRPAPGRPIFTRWAGRTWPMPQLLAEQIWLLRTRCSESLREGPDHVLQLLQGEYGLDVTAAAALLGHCQAQEQVSEIPGSDLLIERSSGVDGWCQLYAFHLPLITPACEAIGRVLAYRLGRAARFQYVPGWLGFGLLASDGVELDPQQLAELMTPVGFERDLERIAATSPTLKDRFTRVATTGMMVLRQPLGARRKVGGQGWTGRRLLQWLRFSNPQFPLLRQALRELVEDVFQVEVAARYLERLQQQIIRVRRLREPSPFVLNWRDANFFEYERYWPTFLQNPSAPTTTTAVTRMPYGVLLDETWLLTPQRAAIHVATQTAVIADLHLGYDSTRRAHGEALPLFGWMEAQARLHDLLQNHSVRRLVIAGDVVEHPHHAHEFLELLDWLQTQGVAIALVPGNHDARLHVPDDVAVCRPGLAVGDWWITHDLDERCTQRQVVGHVHPMLRSPRVGGRAACFLRTEHSLILPAYSEDAAGVNVTSERSWNAATCYAIVNDEVWDMGRVGEMHGGVRARTLVGRQALRR